MKLKCGAPFNSINLTPDGFQVCCFHNQPVYHFATIEEWRESAVIKEAQRQLIEEDYNDICKECLHHGTGGVAGLYQMSSNIVSDATIDVVNFYIDDVCQLACRTCSPQYSHTNNTFRKNCGLPTVPRPEKLPLEQRIDYVNSLPPCNVHIAGGEPMISRRYYDLICNLDRKHHITVITNGQKLSRPFMEEFVKFPSRNIVFSIDGSKSYNESIRVNANTEQFYANLRAAILDYDPECEHTSITYTLSNMSAWCIFEFVQDLTNALGSLARNLYVHGNHATYPAIYSMSNLPQAKRDELANKWRNDKDMLVSLLNHCCPTKPNETALPLEVSIARLMFAAQNYLYMREFDPKLWEEFQQLAHIYDHNLWSAIPIRELM